MASGRTRLALIALVLLIVAGAAAWAVYQRSRRPAVILVRTAPVRRVERLAQIVSMSGEIRELPRRKQQRLPHPPPFEAVMSVNETDILRVKVGQPARISVDALATTTPLTGRVDEIGASPLEVPAARQTTHEGRDFKVVLALDGLPPDLRLGMTCEAEIAIDTRDNVLAIPIAALMPRLCRVDAQGNMIAPLPPGADRKAANKHETRELTGVFVDDGPGQAHFRPVKAGLLGDMDVEILEGLQPEETVITGPLMSLRQLDEGSAVRVGSAEEFERMEAKRMKKAPKAKSPK